MAISVATPAGAGIAAARIGPLVYYAVTVIVLVVASLRLRNHFFAATAPGAGNTGLGACFTFSDSLCSVRPVIAGSCLAHYTIARFVNLTVTVII